MPSISLPKNTEKNNLAKINHSFINYTEKGYNRNTQLNGIYHIEKLNLKMIQT